MRETSPVSVLLVDDDPSLRKLLSMHVEKEGFEARQASDGIDAVVKLRDELPTVIICDLEMPRMSGIEFVSVVRRRYPSIPVIVLSGTIPNEFPADAKPDACFEKGALHFRELLRILHDLAQISPNRAEYPLVATMQVQTPHGIAGGFILACPDCLRAFRVTSTPKAVEGTAICTYCEARVPFMIGSAAPE